MTGISRQQYKILNETSEIASNKAQCKQNEPKWRLHSI